MKRFFAISIVFFFVCPVFARPVKIWSFDELMRSSTVVVIGTIEGTVDTPGGFNGKDYRDVQSKVAISAVVKSATTDAFKPRGTLLISHLGYGPRSLTMVDGPAYVTFKKGDKTVYMIFLTRQGDKLVPTTGDYDPDQSFWRFSGFGPPPSSP